MFVLTKRIVGSGDENGLPRCISGKTLLEKIPPTRLHVRGKRKSDHAIDPPTVFSTFDAEHLVKIHRHQWKEHVKISKFAKFESYMLATGKDTDPQSHEILQMFV